uniref:Uncharacterized protein n=1 Tax=Gasterosteus aculeatus TaxID=69293 RepID=G3NWR7_GASAC
MATTHIYNKLQDTSIYINLSSQNLHSAIAALKQEAKPLTTLNIKGSGDTKRVKGKGIVRKTRQRCEEYVVRRETAGGRWRDKTTGSCQRLFLGMLNGKF